MSERLTDLPDWVWALLDAVADYEDTHPLLYRLNDTAEGALQYERTCCAKRRTAPPDSDRRGPTQRGDRTGTSRRSGRGSREGERSQPRHEQASAALPTTKQ